MNTLNDTTNPTVDHGQTECHCPDDRCAGVHHPIGETCWCTRVLDREVDELVESLTIINGGETDLGTRIEYDDSPEERIHQKAILDDDAKTVTIHWDSAIQILDFTVPAIKEPTPSQQDYMVRFIARAAVFGNLPNNRTVFFSADLTGELEEVNEKIEHPEWCVNDGDCFAMHTSALIEHSAKTEHLKTDTIKAESRLEVIVQHADYKEDLDATIMPWIEIKEGAEFEPVTLHSEPTDLRALGHFLIEQADRIETMINEMGVSA